MRKERGSVETEAHSLRQSTTRRPRSLARADSREAGSETKREESASEAPPQTRKHRQQQTPGPRRGGVCSQALPGIPRFAHPGTTWTPSGAYYHSWSLLGLGRLGESAWAFPADGGVPGVILTDRDPSGLRLSQNLGQR